MAKTPFEYGSDGSVEIELAEAIGCWRKLFFFSKEDDSGRWSRGGCESNNR